MSPLGAEAGVTRWLATHRSPLSTVPLSGLLSPPSFRSKEVSGCAQHLPALPSGRGQAGTHSPKDDRCPPVFTLNAEGECVCKGKGGGPNLKILMENIAVDLEISMNLTRERALYQSECLCPWE